MKVVRYVTSARTEVQIAELEKKTRAALKLKDNDGCLIIVEAGHNAVEVLAKDD